MNDLNMTRQYRAELKTLKAVRRKAQMCHRRVTKALKSIDRRIAILEGRLS